MYRRPISTRLYGRQWRKERALYLKLHPLCKICMSENRVTPATEVDHIIPHKGNYDLFWDVNNWQALCKICHSKKGLNERGYNRNRTSNTLHRNKSKPYPDDSPSTLYGTD